MATRNYEDIQDGINLFTLSKINTDFKYLFETLGVFGKSIQDLVAEGQLTPAQYVDLIRAVNGLIARGDVSVQDIDKSKGLFDATYFTSDFLEQLNNGEISATKILPGSVTTDKLADKTVVPNKTDFFDISENLLNGAGVLMDKSIDFSGNVITESGRWLSDFIEVPTSKIMSITNASYRIGVFSSDGTWITRTGISNNSLIDLNDYLEPNLLIRISGTNIPENVMLNNGSTLKDFVPYTTMIKKAHIPDLNYMTHIEDEGITTEKIANEAVNYDKRTKLGNSGVLVSFTDPINFDLMNNKMQFPKSSHVFTANRWIRIVGAGGDPIEYDMGLDGSSIYCMYFNAKSANDSLDFVFRLFSDDNSDLQDYILLGVISRYAGGFVQINGNYTVNGQLAIADNSITRDKISEDVFSGISSGGGVSKRYHYYDELKGVYQTPINLEDWGLSLSDTVPDDIYSYYDNLRDRFPDRISKRRIGYSQLADGLENTNLPIYEYKYSPFRGDAGNSVKVPKILIQAGIHGYEKMAVWATFKWFEQLLEGNDEVSEFMRNNIDFHVVPIANPHSYFHDIRHNVNGVDINTNFEMDWYKKSNDGSSGSLYGGEEPMSEMETQVLDAWYSEFEGKSIGFIDMHNTGVRTTSQGKYGLCWYISGDEGVRTMSRNILNAMSRKWRKDFPDLDAQPDNIMYGDVSERKDGTARNQALKKYNIKSLSLDPTWTLSSLFTTGGSKYSEPVLNVNIDVLGASVLSFVKNFGE